jgi:hypothetical protein
MNDLISEYQQYQVQFGLLLFFRQDIWSREVMK